MFSLYFKLLCGTFKVLGGSFSISLPCSHSTITSIPLTQILQGWSHYGEKWGEMLESAAFLYWATVEKKTGEGQNEIYFYGLKEKSR